MKVLICGVGKVTRHLLRRLGENWRVTLVDKSEERLNQLISANYNVERVSVGDASSPVVLDDLGLTDYDYLIALTDNDKVNLAATRHAKAEGVIHTLALVNEYENQRKFEKIGVRTVLGSVLIAGKINQFLQDPRIIVTPLTLGPSEIMEVDVSHHFRMVGKKASALSDENWRLIAIYRKKELLFPESHTLIEPEDRLVIVGKPDIFKPVCDLLECGHPHFPLAYGQGLMLALAAGKDHELLIRESMHLAQNTKVKHLIALCSEDDEKARAEVNSWSQHIDSQFEKVEGDLFKYVQKASIEENCGLVVVHPFDAPFFKTLARPTLVSLAHSLSCPLLVARNTHPYEHILVPFNGSPKAELGLDVALDLARQLDAEVAVVIVEEPDFITGPEAEDWVEKTLGRAREIGHIHKITLQEIIREGNPVREIVEAAKNFDLMVIGSTSKEKPLLSPHVGELLIREVGCSVLIVAN